jgi:hypothetical protein
MSALTKVPVTISPFDGVGPRVSVEAWLLNSVPAFQQLADRSYLLCPVEDVAEVAVGEFVTAPDANGAPTDVFEVLSREPDQANETRTRMRVKPARDKKNPLVQANIRAARERERDRLAENEENRLKAQVQTDALARLRGAGFGRLAQRLVSFAPHWDDRFAQARSSLLGALESDVAEADRRVDAEAA